MNALRFRVGRWLRATARPTLLLTVVLAALATVVLATAAGARRTSNAPDRFSTSFGDAPELGAFQDQPGRPPLAEISALPGVRVARSITFVFGVVEVPSRCTMPDTLVFTGSASAVGAPLGFLAGRDVFDSFAASIGGVDDVAVPVGFAATALGALLVVGLLAALTAAVRARRIAPASLVRTG